MYQELVDLWAKEFNEKHSYGVVKYEENFVRDFAAWLDLHAVEQADAPDHKGAVVDEQDDEPVCECGHARSDHHYLWSTANSTKSYINCLALYCGCDEYRPPSGR